MDFEAARYLSSPVRLLPAVVYLLELSTSRSQTRRQTLEVVVAETRRLVVVYLQLVVEILFSQLTFQMSLTVCMTLFRRWINVIDVDSTSQQRSVLSGLYVIYHHYLKQFKMSNYSVFVQSKWNEIKWWGFRPPSCTGKLNGTQTFRPIVSSHHFLVRRFAPNSYLGKTFRPLPINRKDVSPPSS